VVYAHPGTIPGWSEYLWIPKYSDKGGCVWCMPIPVQSRDGQNISGFWDGLGGVDVWCVRSSTTVPGWPEYLWNLRILCHSMASLDIPPTFLFYRSNCTTEGYTFSLHDTKLTCVLNGYVTRCLNMLQVGQASGWAGFQLEYLVALASLPTHTATPSSGPTV